MTVRTQDNESFNRLHAAELLYLPGVRQIRTFVVLKQVLSTTELPIGLVDIKVAAVSEIWSGLKLMIRKELR